MENQKTVKQNITKIEYKEGTQFFKINIGDKLEGQQARDRFVIIEYSIDSLWVCLYDPIRHESVSLYTKTVKSVEIEMRTTKDDKNDYYVSVTVYSTVKPNYHNRIMRVS